MRTNYLNPLIIYIPLAQFELQSIAHVENNPNAPTVGNLEGYE